MSVIGIDKDKCNLDGLCALACPVGIIAWPDKNSPPVSTAEAAELCLDCGHCVAACPHGALSQRSMSPAGCPPIREEWKLSPEQAEQFLRSRRSIRLFKKEPVDRDDLARLINLASHAPSGHNMQPVKWRVVMKAEDVKRLSGLVVDRMRHLLKEMPQVAVQWHMDRAVKSYESGIDPVLRDAPHLVLTHAPKDDRSAPAACTIAMAYLELAAPVFGLGACWAGYFHAASGMWPPLQGALGLPEGHACQGAMMLGRPKLKYHRLTRRNPADVVWM